MFGFGKRPQTSVRELSPGELHAMVGARAALVVDVRETGEFAAGHIPGAINMPLSRFDAAALPDAAGRLVVLNCAAGRRSAMALGKCRETGIDTHLRGGMSAWTQAGLPVELGR